MYKKINQVGKEIMGKDMREENKEDSEGESISESIFMTKDFLKSLSLQNFRNSISKENMNKN